MNLKNYILNILVLIQLDIYFNMKIQRILIAILLVMCTASILHNFYLQRNIKKSEIEKSEIIDHFFDLKYEYETMFDDYMLLEEEHFIMSEEYEILASCCSESSLQE